MQGRRELGGGPEQIFFRGSYFKKFSGKNVFGQQQPPPGRVRCNCFPATLPQFLIPNFGTLPKKTNILSFARKYFTKKNDWGPIQLYM